MITVKVIVGQDNCPQGYVMRNIQCGGKIISKCIPEGYKPEGVSWTVRWASLSNATSAGAADWFSTYEQAVEAAHNKKPYIGVNGKPIMYDVNNYIIFLPDTKLCNTNSSSVNTAKTDLQNSIKSFLIRYKDELANWRNRMSLNLYAPGAVTSEYNRQLTMAYNNVKNLESMLVNMSDKNMSEINKAFADIKNEEITLKNNIATFESNQQKKINENNAEAERKMAEQKLKQQQYLQQQQQEAAATRNAEIQRKMLELRQKQQQEDDMYKRRTETMKSALTEIGNIFIERQREKAAEAEQRRQMERESQRRQEEADNARRAYLMMEAQKRIEERAALAREQETDSIFLGGNLTKSNPSTGLPTTLQKIYYVSYERFYNTNELIIHLYTLNRYSDGTWIFMNDYLKKINFKENQSSTGVAKLVGYFKTEKEATDFIKSIKKKGEESNCKVQIIYETITEKPTPKVDPNFWNNE